MKKNILLLALIILMFLLVGAGFTFQNEPDGFRKLKWGDPPTEDMIYRPTAEGDKVYIRPNDKMYIGNAQFYLINYVFYDTSENLMMVILYFEEKKNFDLLKTICRGRFGEEIKEEFYTLWWLGSKTVIRLTYNIFNEQGNLSLASTQTLPEWKETQEQKEIKKSKEDW